MMNTTELRRLVDRCGELSTERQKDSAYIEILEKYFNGEDISMDIENLKNE